MVAVSADDFGTLPSEAVKGTSRSVRFNVAPQSPNGNAAVAVKDPNSEMQAVGAAEQTKRLEALKNKTKQHYVGLFSRAGYQPRRSTRPGVGARTRDQRILSASRAPQMTTPSRADAEKLIAQNPASTNRTVPLPASVLERRDVKQRLARAGINAMREVSTEVFAEALASSLLGPVAAVAVALTPKAKDPGLRPTQEQLLALRSRAPRNSLFASTSKFALGAPVPEEPSVSVEPRTAKEYQAALKARPTDPRLKQTALQRKFGLQPQFV